MFTELEVSRSNKQRTRSWRSSDLIVLDKG